MVRAVAEAAARGPRAVAPTPWMVKVMPSALGLVSWKSNEVVNLATSTGVAVNALPASLPPPSVSRTAVPLCFAEPFSCSAGPYGWPAPNPAPPSVWVTSISLILLLLEPAALLT